MARGPVVALLLACVLVAGCGGSAGPSDAPVRALMGRYLQAMMSHDWVQACALLTPEAAERRRSSAPDAASCPAAESFEAGEGATNPMVHPERAGQEFASVRIQRIVMRGASAQIFIKFLRGQPEFPLLAVRRAGRWLLHQDLEVGVPIDSYSGTLH